MPLTMVEQYGVKFWMEAEKVGSSDEEMMALIAGKVAPDRVAELFNAMQKWAMVLANTEPRGRC
jgi:hypothetical protein